MILDLRCLKQYAIANAIIISLGSIITAVAVIVLVLIILNSI